MSYDGAFAQNHSGDTFHYFTHDAIYFYDFTKDEPFTHNNDEMLDIYKFASEDGADVVYQSGYIDALQMHYKVIPHGLAYAQEDLGFFDLLIVA